MAGRRWDALRRTVRQDVPRSVGQGLLESLLALFAGIPLLVLSVLGIALVPLGIGLLLAPVALGGVRALAQRQRERAAQWQGVPIAQPYRPDRRHVLTDPATWRDLLWLGVNIPVGFVLGLVPLIFVGGMVNFLVLGTIWSFQMWPDPMLSIIALVLSVVLACLAPTAGRTTVKLHVSFCASMLAPSRRTLAARVEGLTRSRAEVRDASAMELRRIERDLHDGAQARLAALGLSIGLAEQLVHQNPDEAVQILTEARESSGQALADLRSLVRGILPPVLAERGLEGAVQALAAALPVPVEVRFGPEIALPQAAESALYFAIAEALANVAKHSQARRAAVVVVGVGEGAGARVAARIEDDGVGGADPAAGGGLRGVERRLAAFDGALAVASPAGGPTVVTMEVPVQCGY